MKLNKLVQLQDTGTILSQEIKIGRELFQCIHYFYPCNFDELNFLLKIFHMIRCGMASCCKLVQWKIFCFLTLRVQFLFKNEEIKNLVQTLPPPYLTNWVKKNCPHPSLNLWFCLSMCQGVPGNQTANLSGCEADRSCLGTNTHN